MIILVPILTRITVLRMTVVMIIAVTITEIFFVVLILVNTSNSSINNYKNDSSNNDITIDPHAEAFTGLHASFRGPLMQLS